MEARESQDSSLVLHRAGWNPKWLTRTLWYRLWVIAEDGRRWGLGSLLRILGATRRSCDVPEQAGGLLCSRDCAYLSQVVDWCSFHKSFVCFSPVTSSWYRSGSPHLKSKTKQMTDKSKLEGQKVGLLAHGTDRFKGRASFGHRNWKIAVKICFFPSSPEIGVLLKRLAVCIAEWLF